MFSYVCTHLYPHSSFPFFILLIINEYKQTLSSRPLQLIACSSFQDNSIFNPRILTSPSGCLKFPRLGERVVFIEKVNISKKRHTFFFPLQCQDLKILCKKKKEMLLKCSISLKRAIPLPGSAQLGSLLRLHPPRSQSCAGTRHSSHILMLTAYDTVISVSQTQKLCWNSTH